MVGFKFASQMAKSNIWRSLSTVQAKGIIWYEVDKEVSLKLCSVYQIGSIGRFHQRQKFEDRLGSAPIAGSQRQGTRGNSKYGSLSCVLMQTTVAPEVENIEHGRPPSRYSRYIPTGFFGELLAHSLRDYTPFQPRLQTNDAQQELALAGCIPRPRHDK